MRTVLRRSVKKPVLLLPSFVRELVPTFLWACAWACACSYLDRVHLWACSYLCTARPLLFLHIYCRTSQTNPTSQRFIQDSQSLHGFEDASIFLTDLKAIVFPHQRFVDMWEHLKLFPVLWDILKFPFQLFATEWNRGFLASLSSVYIN